MSKFREFHINPKGTWLRVTDIIRDRKPESHLHVIEYSAFDQAQKRIQELESEVSRLTQNCKGLVSDHHKNLKRIQELEEECKNFKELWTTAHWQRNAAEEKIKTLEADLAMAMEALDSEMGILSVQRNDFSYQVLTTLRKKYNDQETEGGE